MKQSLQLRMMIALTVVFATMTLAAIINLIQFKSYENQTNKIFSGDQKNMIDGQLLEAKAKALESVIENSVSSAEGNDEFKEKLNIVLQDIKSLEIKNVKLDSLDDIKKTPEDLFIAYRNIKTTAFQIYRTAWANKWMNLARMVGMILNDVDNIPYQNGDKAFSSINTKITQITAMVTTSAIPQPSKLTIFGYLSGLKEKIVKYSESFEKSVKLKHLRESFVNKIVSDIHDYNSIQTKNLSKFTSGNSNVVMIAFMVFMTALLLSIILYWLNLKGFSKHINETFGSINKQLSNWFTPSGTVTIQEIKKPRYLDYELTETFEVLDQIIKKVNNLRKEDAIVKKMLNVPFVLISKSTKKAVYWNSSISNLGKIKSIDEMGATPYINLIKFTDIQNKVADPVEKCILDGKESTSLLLFKSGPDNIATQVMVTPILNSYENEIEYIFVQIRDLREENKRLEAELDRQLETVRVACNELKSGKIPTPASKSVRLIIQNAIESLRSFAIVHSNKQENVTHKIEEVWEKVTRENQLKHKLQEKFQSIANEMVQFTETFNNIQILSEGLKETSSKLGEQNKNIIYESEVVCRKGQRFADDVKRTKTLLASSLAELARAEELTKSVRVHEKTIHMLMQKASLLTINNTILENKKQFNPDDLIMITENINQILIQFQRTYRLIETSVADIEKGYHNIGLKIRDQLSHAMALVASDQAVIEGVNHQTQNLQIIHQNIDQVFNHVDTFDEISIEIKNKSKLIIDKADKMIELTKASLQLHDQIESSLKEVTSVQSDSSKLEGQSQHVSSVFNATSVS